MIISFIGQSALKKLHIAESINIKFNQLLTIKICHQHKNMSTK